MVDYTESLPGSLTNQAASMKAEKGYVRIVDYTDSDQLPGSLTNQAASMKKGYMEVVDYTESKQLSGSLNDQAASRKAEEGYVDVVDYTDSVSHQSGSFCNKSTSNDSSLIFRDGYENLPDSSVRSEESGYTQLRKQPHEYLEILAEP